MDFAVSFLAVLAIAAFLVVRFKLNASVAPFATVAGITLFLCFLGTLNLLFPATLVVFALALLSLYYLCWVKRKGWRETIKSVFTPGFAFFIVASLIFVIAVGVKNPYFTFWDEFSFWGVAAKNVVEHRQIYTLFQSSMINISYPPALPVWSYFMQVWGKGFSEWRVYAAYDVLIASVMTLLFARIKWKNFIAIPVIGFTAMSCTYLFWYSFEGLGLYVTSYSDIPLGIVFGGVLLAYFATSEERTLPNYFAALTGLMLLPMIKDVGLAFGLIAVVIMSFDMLASGHWPTKKVLGTEKWFGKPVYIALLLVGLFLSYQIWTLHLGSVISVERNAVPYAYSLMQMLRGEDPYFNEMGRVMWEALGVRQLLTFGTVKEMMIVFTAIPILLSLLCKEKKNILRIGAASIELCAGFLLYYCFQTYAYVAIFAHRSDFQPVSYERYISTYAIGWMFVVLGLSLYAISQWRFKKGDTIPGIVVCALSIYALFVYSPVPFDQYIFTSEKVYISLAPLRELMANNAAKFKGAFDVDDRIYYVCQDSDGGDWFYFNYEFQPAYTVKTLGGGHFVPIGSANGMYDMEADVARFTEYLQQEEVDYVFVQKIDDYFFEQFAPMFTDGLMGFYDGTVSMYKVIHEGDGIMLRPVYSAEGVDALRAEYGY